MFLCLKVLAPKWRSIRPFLQKLLIEEKSDQVMDSSRFTTINDLSQDIHLWRQAFSVLRFWKSDATSVYACYG
jgi:hypothetical protein